MRSTNMMLFLNEWRELVRFQRRCWVLGVGILALQSLIPNTQDLILQRRVQPQSILSRPAGRIEGCGLDESHPSIRDCVPLRFTPSLLRMLRGTVLIDSAL